jgi:hypothetical protein
MDSLHPFLLTVLAAGAGALALLNLTHLAVMSALRLRLVAAIWLAVTLTLLAVTIEVVAVRLHAPSFWAPLLLALALGAPVSRELADWVAWLRDRDAATHGWLAKINGKGALGFRGHIYRAAAAAGRTQFEEFDETQDFWLSHWASRPLLPPPTGKPKPPVLPSLTPDPADVGDLADGAEQRL